MSLPSEVTDTYHRITRLCQYKKLLVNRGHDLRNITSKGEKNSRHSYAIQDSFTSSSKYKTLHN